jgi:branched-subunit amino acid transport protein
MKYLNIFVFLGKALLIEIIIEILRFTSTALFYNIWPKDILLTHSNKGFSWTLNIIESLSVMTLLYLNYSSTFIIVVVFCLTWFIKTMGNQLYFNGNT